MDEKNEENESIELIVDEKFMKEFLSQPELADKVSKAFDVLCQTPEFKIQLQALKKIKGNKVELVKREEALCQTLSDVLFNEAMKDVESKVDIKMVENYRILIKKLSGELIDNSDKIIGDLFMTPEEEMEYKKKGGADYSGAITTEDYKTPFKK